MFRQQRFSAYPRRSSLMNLVLAAALLGVVTSFTAALHAAGPDRAKSPWLEPQKTFADLKKEKIVAKKLFETPVPAAKDYPFNTPVGHADGKTFYVWRDSEGWRPRVTMVDADGKATTEFLDPNPDYRASKDAHNSFSLGIDKSGYIHVLGDMHNGPPRRGLPQRYAGSFILYWKSRKPYDISSFEFLGKDAARRIPAQDASYYGFRYDRTGEMYMTCRTRILREHVGGMVGMGLYHYNTQAGKWEELGGLPPGFESKASGKVLVWEDNGQGKPGKPGWYQWSMAEIRFDLQNRMHLAVTWTNDSESPEGTHVLYACSEDGGKTWRKADGSKIAKLPLRCDPGPNQADIVVDAKNSVFRGIDSKTVVMVDPAGNPAVVIAPKGDGQRYRQYVRNHAYYWDAKARKWDGPHLLPAEHIWTRTRSYLANNGVLTTLSSGGQRNGFVRMVKPGFQHDQFVHWDLTTDPALGPHDPGPDLFNIDIQGADREDIFRGLGDNVDKKHLILYEVRFVEE